MEFYTPDQIARELELAQNNKYPTAEETVGKKYLRSLVPENGLREMFEGMSRQQEERTETDPEIRNLPSSVDLRKWASRADDQGQEGTCTAHGTLNCLMLLMNKETGLRYDLSERYHWLNYQQYNTWKASQALCAYWQGPEELWPEGATSGKEGWEDARLATLTGPREATSLSAMKAHLASGQPIALSVGLDGAYWGGTVILGDRGTQKAGHCVMLCGYVDTNEGGWDQHGGGYFILLNSWSERLGDKGYQYISYSYFTSNRFWTNNVFYNPDVLWRPGKKPGGGGGGDNPEGVDLQPVVYRKYKYTPANSAEHGAYGVTIQGKDTGRIKSVNWVLNSSVPVWSDTRDFSKTFGTYAASGWPAGRAEVTLDDGKVIRLEFKIP